MAPAGTFLSACAAGSLPRAPSLIPGRLLLPVPLSPARWDRSCGCTLDGVGASSTRRAPSVRRNASAETVVPYVPGSGKYIAPDYLVRKVSAEEVQELVRGHMKVLLIVDFYATWCGPVFRWHRTLRCVSRYSKAWVTTGDNARREEGFTSELARWENAAAPPPKKNKREGPPVASYASSAIPRCLDRRLSRAIKDQKARRALILKFISELNLAAPKVVEREGRSQQNPPSWWIPPAAGCTKINIDVALSNGSAAGSAATVARDDGDMFLGVPVVVMTDITDPKELEALACKEGLRWPWT